MKRRNFLVAAGAALVAGCNRIAETNAGKAVLDAADSWHKNAQRLLTTDPQNGDYPRHVEEGFANWRLEVTGLVANPLSLSLENIRRLPQRTQITRHDCVEGWSAIGQWTGPQLSVLLDAAELRDDARFVIFRCADNLNGGDYYESVDLIDAYHPQTIIAHSLNGQALPVRNGAPLRMRIERQLGYKHAKYLTGIEAVASLDDVGLGKGGYWEDRAGYQWYAGI